EQMVERQPGHRGGTDLQLLLRRVARLAAGHAHIVRTASLRSLLGDVVARAALVLAVGPRAPQEGLLLLVELEEVAVAPRIRRQVGLAEAAFLVVRQRLDEV